MTLASPANSEPGRCSAVKPPAPGCPHTIILYRKAVAAGAGYWYHRNPCRVGAGGRQLKIGSCVKLQSRIVRTGLLAADDRRTAYGL